MKAAQIPLDLQQRPALGAEDFLISQSNMAAADLVDRWPDWPHAAVVVVAPARAGKTHLANVWRLKSGAGVVNASELGDACVPAATPAKAAALLVEDLHAGIGSERVLFHLLNLVRERALSMLLTSRSPPGELGIRLPDLASRLKALPVVTIADPDDALFKAVLVKQFNDRQVTVNPVVIDYLARHMERSMQAAATVVAQLDRLALGRQGPITRELAREILAKLAAGKG
jgi:chromosomal replication initiation ATPase DnaA